ncbi:hypothetical protein [Flavobacterium sp. GT3P67]|uniref:hypothetical protein n=1 Tax=Flavobacterium sp. GT3P67 TaxID=2541722 RepID=UPI001042FAEB|nr:hypothetical protein [Flavobacterium sp. GT3P67]TDE53066.1 hypothetical protein E0H99_10335 [Flavobacterium sp. GT3P67]
MKKHLLIVLLALITSSTFAQKLTSGNYTITISNIKSRSYTQDVFGEIKNVKEYIGNYTIEKSGEQIANQKFSTMQMEKDTMTLNIKDDDKSGNSLSYDFETKKYEIAGDEFKAKSSKDIDNIILSGILIYAQWLENN